MVILVVDNDMENLCNLEQWIKACRSEDEIISFSDSVLELEYIEEHEVDILFTEVKMAGATGFILTKHLKNKNNNSYVIFMTDSPTYAMNAWEAHVNGYVLKPLNQNKIEVELEYADV